MCNKLTVKNWIDAKKQVDHWKKVEVEYRNKLLDDIQIKKSYVGTLHKTWGEYNITATYKTNKSVDSDALKAIWDDMSKDEQSAFQYKPSIVLSKYKDVSESDNVASCVIEKPAQGSLSLKIIEG